MSKIVYRRLTTLFADKITVQNELGILTTFSDCLAYSAFVHGIDKLRAGGADLTLLSEEGTVIVGDVTDTTNRIEAA
jgi:hypothetical protein